MSTSRLAPTLIAGSALAVSFAPVDIGYGLIVFQLLGHGYDGLGVASGWIAVLVSTVLVSGLMRTGHLFTSVRPAQTLSVASLLAILLAQAADLPAADKASLALSTVMVCTALAGLFQLIMGLAHVGRLVSFVPRPVLSGVASAAAIGLALKALKSLWTLYGDALTVPVDGPLSAMLSPPLHQPLMWVVFISVLLMLMTWAARRLVYVNWSLVGLLAGTALFWSLEAVWPSSAGGPAMGPLLPPMSVVSQLPLFINAWASLAQWDRLAGLLTYAVPYAFVIAVINSLEALVYNARFERSTEIAHSPRALLISLGVGNTVGGLLGGLPVSLSSTKMTLAWQSGVRTQTGVAAHTAMLLLLVLTTAWYVHLIPKIAVSLVMLYLAWVMLDAWSRQQLRQWLLPASLLANLRSPQSTPIIFAIVILSALASNLAWGVAVGLACAVFVFVQRQSQSVVRRIGTLSSRRSVVMRDAKASACLEQNAARVLSVELQGALFFGTSEQLLRAVREALTPEVQLILLDAHRVLEVDDSGCETIERLQGDLVKRGGGIVLSGWDEHIQWRSRSEIAQLKKVMKQPVFRTLDEAAEFAEDWLIARTLSEDERTAWCEFDPTGESLRIFQKMDANRRTCLMTYMHRVAFDSDATLFHRGDVSDALYIVMSGRVDIWLNRGTPQAMRLASFRPGVSFGEMGLLRDEPRTADAIAVGEVLALRLSRESFNQLRQQSPDVLADLLVAISQDLSHRLSQTNRVLRRALL